MKWVCWSSLPTSRSSLGFPWRIFPMSPVPQNRFFAGWRCVTGCDAAHYCLPWRHHKCVDHDCQDRLKERHVPIGVEDGFKVVDLRSGEKLELTYDGVIYRGFLDAGVVPFGLAGYSCLRQLRVGVELKQTAAQKKMFRELHPDGMYAAWERCMFVPTR
jgi:hypothetical protein